MAHKIERILCTTDFSEQSDQAARSAAAIAAEFGATLVLLHVTEPQFDYESYGLGAETIAAIRDDLRSGIEKKLEAVKQQCGPQINVETVVREGMPAQEILAYAEQGAIDMIVIATHGRSGVKHFVIGSVAEKVVRHARCPVLTLRPGTSSLAD